ncbi:MAG: O-antigen ligase family protein, partial [Bacteroidales bacterium]|nr:O-antigen ligase family protein [Bacteroidales bacterium]
VLLLAPKAFWRTLRRSDARWYALGIVLLCLYGLASSLWMPARDIWVTYTMFLWCGGVTTLLVVGSIDCRRMALRALRVFEVCAAVVALGALVEILSGHYWFNEVCAGDYIWARGQSLMHLPLPVFAMSNVNDFGAYLFFALAATLWLMMADRHRVWRWGRLRIKASVGHSMMVLLLLFLMLCTQSRSVFLALIVAGMVGFGCYLLQKPPHWKWLAGLAGALLFVAGTGFCVFWLHDQPAYSDAVRMGVVRNAWLFYKPVWYRGLGWGGVDYYNIQYPVYTIDAMPHLHNWFLEILFNCGLFVFGFYAWVYMRTWWQGVRLTVTRRSWESIIVVAVLSGFVVLSIASSSFVGHQWFWGVGALGFGVAGIALSDK